MWRTRMWGVIAAAVAGLACVEGATAADTDVTERVVSEKLVARITDLSKEVLESFTVSPDNRRVAYTTVVGGLFGRKLSVVVDGQEIGQFDNVVGGTLLFSADGRRLAFGALRGGKRIVIVDGKEITGHERLGGGSFIFSSDGKRFAYAAATSDRKWSVIVDGQPGKLHDSIGNGNIRFSPDGRRFAYAATDDEKSFVVIDGQEGRRYDGIADSSLVFSPDGRASGYVARMADKWLAVIGDRHFGPYERVGNIVFSEDGKRFGYSVLNSGVAKIVIEGQEHARHDSVGAGFLTFSPDGGRVAYGAVSGGKSFVVVDHAESPGYTNLAGAIIFSRDGRRMAYQAVKGNGRPRWFVVVDGRELGPYDGLSDMSFSPDGNHLAFAARNGDSWSVMLDGKVGTPHHGLARGGKIQFDSPNEFHYLATRKGGGVVEVYLVEEKLVRGRGQ